MREYIGLVTLVVVQVTSCFVYHTHISQPRFGIGGMVVLWRAEGVRPALQDLRGKRSDIATHQMKVAQEWYGGGPWRKTCGPSPNL